LHSHHLKLCERTLTFRGLPCGKRVRWLGWSGLTDLAQPNVFNYAEKCQERNFLRFPAVRPTSLGNERTDKPVFANVAGLNRANGFWAEMANSGRLTRQEYSRNKTAYTPKKA
jgi:hypothetical protein